MPDEADKIKQEIIAKLEEVRDPKTGEKFITHAYDPYKIYDGPYMGLAPDVVVGYKSGYRISDEAALGRFPQEIVGDRTDKWSADHCMDPAVVPGVLLTNRPVTHAKPGLWDLAPSILQAFGLKMPAEMDGKDIFA
jgi:predicted AlkP superfamily phosphohydrolase/phosphomutase